MPDANRVGLLDAVVKAMARGRSRSALRRRLRRHPRCRRAAHSCLAGLTQGTRDSIITAAAAFALTLLFVRWERASLGSVGARINGTSSLRVLLGFAVGLVLVGAWAVLSAFVGQVQWVRVSGATGQDVALALTAYLALATREKLAFRGYPLRMLERSFGATVAQVVVASVFALEHRLGGTSWPDALIGVGIGSLLFGAAALATRGLAVPIGIHAAWNFGQWSLSLKGPKGIWRAAGAPSNTAGAYRMALLSYATVMLAATLAFSLQYWYWRRRQAKKLIVPSA
jgi:membrane protease YdiL (CAAX protease family)